MSNVRPHPSAMRAMSTSDVPLDLLRKFRDNIARNLSVVVDDRQIFFKSTEPPSWLVLLADAPWWVKALGTYAALFVAKIVAEAAKG